MTNMKRIRIDEIMMEGSVSVERGDGWLKPWRLPFGKRALFPPEEGLIARAEMAAGVRLFLATDSRAIGVSFVPGNAPIPVDLTLDGALLQASVLEPGADTVLFESLPEGDKTVEIWFGQTSVVQVCDVFVEPESSFRVPPDPRPKWITYGSSITHCGAAHSPSRTWPATAARALGLNLTCLGYGGQCHIDPMMARMIRDMPADIITLKLGINVCGGASLSPRTFRPAIIGMVSIIREKHPCIPIAVMSPIISPPREDTDNCVGLSLRKMRAEAADAVQRLQDCGDENLHYVDGLELFDADWIDPHLPDDLHPDGDGYEWMGQRIAERVLMPLLPKG